MVLEYYQNGLTIEVGLLDYMAFTRGFFYALNKSGRKVFAELSALLPPGEYPPTRGFDVIFCCCPDQDNF